MTSKSWGKRNINKEGQEIQNSWVILTLRIIFKSIIGINCSSSNKSFWPRSSVSLKWLYKLSVQSSSLILRSLHETNPNMIINRNGFAQFKQELTNLDISTLPSSLPPLLLYASGMVSFSLWWRMNSCLHQTAIKQ